MSRQDNEQRELCDRLAGLEPGWLPQNVFRAIARLVVTPTFVVVPLLLRGPRIFVLLNARDADDPHYASLLHPVGTVLRANDHDLSATYRRLVATELPGIAIKRGPCFVDIAYDQIGRGRELSLVHWVELDDGDQVGNLFDVTALPHNIVPTDYSRIERAAAHFRSVATGKPAG